MRQPKNGKDPGSANVLHFNLTGLILFCLCLVAGTAFIRTQGTNNVFKPSDEYAFSLKTETRDRLYSALRGLEVNVYLDWPYYYPRDTVESVFADVPRSLLGSWTLLRPGTCAAPTLYALLSPWLNL
jgi:hypothetical protein